MKKFTLIVFLIFTQYSFSQENIGSEIITLAEVFHTYHWDKPDSKALSKLNKVKSIELADCKSFIKEIIKTKNNILDVKYTRKPSLRTLKYMYIILKVNYNMFEEKPLENFSLIEALKNEDIDEHELLTFYYRTIFASLVNKNLDRDYSKINFRTEELNLNTETEKAVFFLVAMERFGTYVWGYMNITNGNCKKVREEIRRWPRFDGEKFNSPTGFSFIDFKVEVDKREPKVEFKKYYLEKLNETISYYQQCKDSQ